MNFCEQCGQRLTPDARFCEQCGAAAAVGKTVPEEVTDRAGFFDESCVVVINRAGWRARWGHGDATALELDLRKYLTVRSQQSNVAYTICDVSAHGIGESPDWRQVVAAIKNALGGRSPKFIFLIGGSTDLPMGEFTNPFRDNIDDNVHTDYCYSLLSDADLGLPEAVLPTVPKHLVGRLPLGRDTTPAHVRRYFHNAAHQGAWPGHGRKNIAGVSAKAWEAASEQVFRNLNVHEPELHRSPAFRIDDFDRLVASDPSCLFFNVHGGSQPEEIWWRGDNGEQATPGTTLELYEQSLRPKVVDSERFNFNSINVTISEACYGGRFFNPASQEEEFLGSQSILLKALFDKTIAFVGASKVTFAEFDSMHEICYGASDKLATEFLAPVARESSWSAISQPLGETMLRARLALQSHAFDESANGPAYLLGVKKMFLAFNLFGDPTLFRPPSRINARSNSERDLPEAPRDLHESLMSDLRDAVSGSHGRLRREVFGRVNQLHQSLRGDIRDGVGRLVFSIYPHLDGVQPVETCWQSDDGAIGYLLSYTKHVEGIDCRVFVSCDGQGKIQRTLTPK
jgi:hypothetical protein